MATLRDHESGRVWDWLLTNSLVMGTMRILLLTLVFTGVAAFMRSPARVFQVLVDDDPHVALPATSGVLRITRLHLTVNYIDTLMEKGRKTRNWNPAVQEVKAFLAEGSLRRLHPIVLTKAIRLFALAGLVDDSIGILRNAQASGYKKINVLHYNAAMTACRNHKRYTSGLELFEEMQLEPDRVHLVVVLHFD